MGREGGRRGGREKGRERLASLLSSLPWAAMEQKPLQQGLSIKTSPLEPCYIESKEWPAHLFSL